MARGLRWKGDTSAVLRREPRPGVRARCLFWRIVWQYMPPLGRCRAHTPSRPDTASRDIVKNSPQQLSTCSSALTHPPDKALSTRARERKAPGRAIAGCAALLGSCLHVAFEILPRRAVSAAVMEAGCRRLREPGLQALKAFLSRLSGARGARRTSACSRERFSQLLDVR
ncbi:hypothetical protein NDU88_007164 [Pleurodeles waltl]|uniref:Uncharacterized protein n=1 Tax=Pleurodeles waltl TaxID=8319 RepID=A0AAV7P036_PLEWA|nr:hypothetical protein NDU88_007164 [Pleurodeles waltl]